MFGGSTAPSGSLSVKVIRAPKAPLSWRLRNAARWGYIHGWLSVRIVAPLVSKLFSIATITSSLALKVTKADGSVIDYGTVGYKVVTDVGVAFLVDALQGAVEPELLRYHGIGETNTAENQTDTDLVAEITTEYTSDNTRPTGTLAEGATANIFRSVGTITVDAAVAAVEHAIFSDPTVGSGTVLDRTVFATVNLGDGDSLQATYELTLTAGS